MSERFREDSAATIRITPQHGPPITSATIELYKPDNTILQASTSATIPTVSTAINLAAGYPVGSKTIILDDTTGISPGDELWVGTLANDSQELVSVRTVDSATQIQLHEGTRFAHDDNEEVRGAEITYALTATHTADKDENYRADWTYTVGSTTYKVSTLFDVVARVFTLSLGAHDLRVRLPAAVRRQAPGAGELLEIIIQSENAIVRQLRLHGLKPDRVRDIDQFTELGILGVLKILLERQFMLDPSVQIMVEDARLMWREEFDRIMTSGLSWYDKDEDLSVETADSQLGDEDEEGVQRVQYGILA